MHWGEYKESGYKKNYNTLLPYLNLSYQPQNSSKFTLSYNNGVQRPGIVMLNPFMGQYSGYTGNEGNPNLLYSRTHTLGLNYMKFSNTLFFFGGISYKHQKNAIVSYSYYNPDTNMLISTYENIDGTNEIGLDLYLNYRPINMLSMTVAGNMANYNMKGRNHRLNQNSIIYNATAMCDVFLKKDWTLGLQYGNYRNRPDAWSYNYAFSLYSFYLNKAFLQGALNIRAVINSPFHKYNKFKVRKDNDSYSCLQSNYATARSFGISVSYTLRNGKTRSLKRDRSLQSTDQQTGIN